MKKDIFVYGLTNDNKITLTKEYNLTLDIKGCGLVEYVDIESIKDFVGQHFDNGLVSYDELHDFCVNFLICDNTPYYKEIKDLLKED